MLTLVSLLFVLCALVLAFLDFLTIFLFAWFC